MVDDDPVTRATVSALLRPLDLKVEVVGSSQEALELFEARPIDVLVTDLELGGGRDGLALIDALRSVSPSARAILISAAATAASYAEALRLGAVQVLLKPLDRAAFIEAVQRAALAGAGYRAELFGVGLPDVLQLLHYGRSTTRVQVTSEVAGWIDFVQGEVHHAECGGAIGREAFARLLREPTGLIRATAMERLPERSVELPFQMLLLDTLRSIDEAERGASLEADPADVEHLDGGGASLEVDGSGEAHPAPSDEGAYAVARVTALLDAFAPQLSAVLIAGGEVRRLRGDPLSEEELGRARALAEAVQVLPGWRYFEHVAGRHAVALLRSSEGGVVALSSGVARHVDQQRFRSQMQHLCGQLAEEAEAL